MRKILFTLFFSMAGSLVLLAGDADKPFIHPLFTDYMVLQRDIDAPVWGWTVPGKEVTVSMEGKSAKTVAGADGKWLAKIGPFAAGGPYTLTVSGPNSVTLKNILVGDVWICSGQSNMEMGIGAVKDGTEEIAKADYPQIRIFSVPHKVAFSPQETVNGNWQACSPATIGSGGWAGFTAVGYFFGRHLHQELKIPIGLIHTSWGGTICEAWTSGPALKAMSDFAPGVVEVEAAAEKIAKQGDLGSAMDEWYRKNDPGSAKGLGWADPAFDAKGWKTMKLPQYWEGAGLPDFDGIVWFRKEFDLPQSWTGKGAMLHLGPVDDRDTTWVNGVKIGAIDLWSTPRDYKVASNILKPGRNIIAVRVLDTGGGGGIYGKPEEMKLEIAGDANTTPISLAGDWLYQDSTPLQKTMPMPVSAADNPNVVTVLYNGMIAPLIPFGIKGAIWYQGESNGNRGLQYRTLLPTMIKDWRSRFGVGDFPFFIVQLANFMATDKEPAESGWAEVREAQEMTAFGLSKCGQAVAIDIGETNDIHPKNKQEVGRRLGLAAQAIAYGQKIEFSGPIYKSMEIKDKSIRLSFDHTGSGLMLKGDKLQGFAIAGNDKKFVWADARIDGESVVVSSTNVDQPVAVRYAWGNNPVCNLYNKEGLPASPFRTDSKK